MEIPQAEDLASRVEELLNEYDVKGIAEDIRRLTAEYGNREVVSLMAAKEVANRPAESREKAIDRAIRVGLAVLTEGILVAPLEGIADTRIKKNADGSEYIDLMFAGPIRAAGGTAQAMSVLIADVVRQAAGIGKYVPTEQEVDRFIEEIPLYKQCQHIQYSPSNKEIQLIVGRCPICIDGEGTERMEISGFRDLPRIETNQVRGGACLVIAEGLCQKAAKIKKHVDKLKLEGWEFMGEYLAMKNAGVALAEDAARRVVPSEKYLMDIVAGRPIFGHPSRVGGFRLRYGRGRTCGLAALAFSPASMYMLDEFPALGTQIKIERPGKACVVTPCDELEGPIVVLKDGSLVQCDTAEEALAVRADVAEITDCGEVLVPFGEFCENNHFLVPCGYPIEWHRLELEAKGPLPEDWEDPTWERVKGMSRELGVPLHPKFNLFWSDTPMEELARLRAHILETASFEDGRLRIPKEAVSKRALEDLGAVHRMEGGCAVLERYALPLVEGLGLSVRDGGICESRPFEGETQLAAVSAAMGIEVRARAGTRIGMRMARPEKAKDRKGAPVVHGLFPVGDNPEYRKEVTLAVQSAKAASRGGRAFIEAGMGERECPSCHRTTYRAWCRQCGLHTAPRSMPKERTFDRRTVPVDIADEYQAALECLGVRPPAEVKVVADLISRSRVPEALEKAVLRAHYDLGVYKDGTVRFDMTDIPITHFRPREIGLSVEKARELGYVHDMDGRPLEDDGQLCELKVQDVIPNFNGGDYFVQIAKYVDHLLERFYGLERFYNVTERSQLIGHLGIGLAPHTSGGILCRIIGYTKANGCYAHPFFHAAKRRNCDGDEDCIMLLMDGLVNFSRDYIPDRRGGLMDAPLVLTTRLDPNEIDKEAHNVDCLRRYPIELYRAAMEMRDAKDVEKSMDLIAGRIGTPRQYEGLGFTHDTADISEGPKQSAYTTLVTMMDKMNAQLELGRKIRAVDEKDEATRIINKHFMPDMIGNLRSFSAQTVRCTRCGAKYRRIPLTGTCNAVLPGGRVCGNALTLTVAEASVKKYLKISQEIGEKYQLSGYTRERIDILEMNMDSLFNNDKIRKCKLSDFFRRPRSERGGGPGGPPGFQSAATWSANADAFCDRISTALSRTCLAVSDPSVSYLKTKLVSSPLTETAPLGHISAQVLHRMQSSGALTTRRSPSASKTFLGHAAATSAALHGLEASTSMTGLYL